MNADPEAIARLEAWIGTWFDSNAVYAADLRHGPSADLRHLLSRLKAAEARVAEAERVIAHALSTLADAARDERFLAGFSNAETQGEEAYRLADAFAATPRGEEG